MEAKEIVLYFAEKLKRLGVNPGPEDFSLIYIAKNMAKISIQNSISELGKLRGGEPAERVKELQNIQKQIDLI